MKSSGSSVMGPQVRAAEGAAWLPAELLSGASYSAVELSDDDAAVIMLEQRELPDRERYVRLNTWEEAGAAIADMVVRGAPAIGISAAYALVLAARHAGVNFRADMQRASSGLAATRPTAVNLAWALERMAGVWRLLEGFSSTDRVARLAEEARAIHREDVAACRRMGELGAAFVPDGARILTHCNAGALATGGYGTALGVIRAAHEQGKQVSVFADETRPYLQGSRLTAWELTRDGIPVQVICDSVAASLFRAGSIDLAVVGADRVARSGDVANKIGTYTVACAAKLHDRPLYVAAPWSTVDLGCPSGADIPIEQRDRAEVASFGQRQLVPDGVGVLNPGFDVTPAAMISALFTERGVAQPLDAARLVALGGALGST